MARGCDLTAPFYITDQAPMLPLMKQNVALNDLQGRVVPEVLDW